MNKLFTMLAIAFVAGVMLFSGDALADDALSTAFTKVLSVFQNARRMIFIIGGFGLIALAFFAIFGKIRWNWFAALCVGLGIVAIAGMIIDYVTVDAADGGVSDAAATGTSGSGQLGDSLKNGGGSGS